MSSEENPRISLLETVLAKEAERAGLRDEAEASNKQLRYETDVAGRFLTPRLALLAASTNIEYWAKQLLQGFFRGNAHGPLGDDGLFKFKGPFHQAAKVQVTLSELGLIEGLFLESMRLFSELRNKAAHDPDFQFLKYREKTETLLKPANWDWETEKEATRLTGMLGSSLCWGLQLKAIYQRKFEPGDALGKDAIVFFKFAREVAEEEK